MSVLTNQALHGNTKVRGPRVEAPEYMPDSRGFLSDGNFVCEIHHCNGTLIVVHVFSAKHLRDDISAVGTNEANLHQPAHGLIHGKT